MFKDDNYGNDDTTILHLMILIAERFYLKQLINRANGNSGKLRKRRRLLTV